MTDITRTQTAVATVLAQPAANPGSPIKLAYCVNEIPAYVPVGRTKIFAAIRDGHLVARKLGHRTLVLDEDLRAWLAGLPAARPPSAAA